MDSRERYQVAKQTSYVNATVNSLLALFKMTVGWLGHSSALFADGIHSFSDLLSDALVLVASKMGKKHPDISHPYGHRRIETFAAIVIALLFLSVAVFIVYDAVMHFFTLSHLHKPDKMVLWVAIVSIVANEWLFRYTLKKGKSVHSNLIIANAWHNRSDVYLSVIVLISVTLSFWGILYFDIIGAVIIASLIIKTGLKMIWVGVNELLDAAVDEKTLDNIRSVIKDTSGVIAIHQLRTRLHGGHIFVDVHVQVGARMSVSEGHYISEQVNLRLLNQCQRISDVTVHIDPEDDESSMPSVHLPSRSELKAQLMPCWKHLPGFNRIDCIGLHYLEGHVQVDLVFLWDGQMSIEKTSWSLYQKAVECIPVVKNVRIYFHWGP